MEVENSKNDALPALSFAQTPAEQPRKTPCTLQCLKCSKNYKYPQDKDDMLAHFFLEHRLVIADVDEIALLDDYLRYWQKEFADYELEEYCTTMLLDQLPDGTTSKNEKYYLLSDVLPKDYELRNQLQAQRLERALKQHQYERTDRSFSKACLYCRDVITGLRADYLEHLFNKHFLQLGKPENLVFIDELLEKVQLNLEQLVCLYCEKVFKDRVTLKEHMRKKAHKRINPNNREYDRYFLLNYRNEKPKQPQPNRNRQRPKAEKPRKQSKNEEEQSLETESVDFERRFVARNEDSDSDWSDWNDDEKTLPLNCLYCSEQAQNFDALKGHLQSVHGVNFDAAVEGLNFYQKIKVVNYVRRQICLLRCVTCNLRCSTADKLLQHMSDERHFGMGTQKQWDKPEYFFPTYEDDGLLCILDDNPNDDVDDTVVRIISEDTIAQINKDAERLSLENFSYL